MKNTILVGLLLLSGAVCASGKDSTFQKKIVKTEYDQYEVKSGQVSRTPSPTKIKVFSLEGQDPFSSATYATWAKKTNKTEATI